MDLFSKTTISRRKSTLLFIVARNDVTLTLPAEAFIWTKKLSSGDEDLDWKAANPTPGWKFTLNGKRNRW